LHFSPAQATSSLAGMFSEGSRSVGGSAGMPTNPANALLNFLFSQAKHNATRLLENGENILIIFFKLQEKAGWQEVPPGILFSIRLPNPTCYLRTNAMLKGKFTTVPVHDFYSEFDCTKDEFVRQKILVKSFYQQSHFMDNPIFQLFNAVDFNAIESDILLQVGP
jgi:hypothetical protein